MEQELINVVLKAVTQAVINHLGLKIDPDATLEALQKAISDGKQDAANEKISPAEIQAVIAAVCAVAAILDNDVCPIINVA